MEDTQYTIPELLRDFSHNSATSQSTNAIVPINKKNIYIELLLLDCLYIANKDNIKNINKITFIDNPNTTLQFIKHIINKYEGSKYEKLLHYYKIYISYYRHTSTNNGNRQNESVNDIFKGIEFNTSIPVLN